MNTKVKMTQSVKAGAMALLLTMGSFAYAGDLSENMSQLGRNLAALESANNVEGAKTALLAMQAAAKEAETLTPPSLTGKAADSKEMKDYRQGYVALLATIDQAIALTDDGKLDAAKKLTEEMKTIRNTYHKKYR